MQDWKVVEMVAGVTKLKYCGPEEAKARSEFKAQSALGTKGKLTLLDPEGTPVDEFEALATAGSMTGKPIREIVAPLPPAFVEAAARAREKALLPCLVKAPDPSAPEAETEPAAEQLEVPIPAQLQPWFMRNRTTIVAVVSIISMIIGVAIGIASR